MIGFWRLDDIPELRDVPQPRRRVLWHEAITRSLTARRLWSALGVRFVASLAIGWLSWCWFPSFSPLWAGLIALAVSGIAYDATVRTAAARRWLREHAHELDRYAPA